MVITCLIMTLFLTSCSGGSIFNRLFANKEGSNLYNEQAEANAKMDKVLEAIENKDNTALKSLFSKRTIAEVDYLDQSIMDLFDYVQGDFVSYDDWGGPEGDETWDNGDKQKILYSSYDVKTSTEEYRFAIQNFTVDTADADNVGIHSLYDIKMKDDTDPQLGYRGDNEFTLGIHIGVKNTLPKEDDSIGAALVGD